MDIDELATKIADRLARNPALQFVAGHSVFKFVIAKDVDEFQRWLQRAKPGQHCIYHTGFHLATVEKMRSATQRARDAGLVYLKQVRSVDDEGFHYVAEKRGDSKIAAALAAAEAADD